MREEEEEEDSASRRQTDPSPGPQYVAVYCEAMCGIFCVVHVKSLTEEDANLLDQIADLGGYSWETFPADMPPEENVRQVVQLLAERAGLVIHRDGRVT